MQSMVKSRMSMATWGRWMLVFWPRIVPNPRSAVIVARRVIWQKILARSQWLNQKPNHSLPSLVDVAKVEGKVEERQKEKERETSFEEDKPMDRKLKQWTQPNAFDLCVCFVGLCFVCLVLLGSYFQGNFCPKLDFNPTQNSSSWPTMSRTCPAMREKKRSNGHNQWWRARLRCTESPRWDHKGRNHDQINNPPRNEPDPSQQEHWFFFLHCRTSTRHGRSTTGNSWDCDKFPRDKQKTTTTTKKPTNQHPHTSQAPDQANQPGKFVN